MQSIALAGNARLKEQLLRQEQGRGLSHELETLGGHLVATGVAGEGHWVFSSESVGTAPTSKRRPGWW